MANKSSVYLARHSNHANIVTIFGLHELKLLYLEISKSIHADFFFYISTTIINMTDKTQVPTNFNIF